MHVCRILQADITGKESLTLQVFEGTVCAFEPLLSSDERMRHAASDVQCSRARRECELHREFSESDSATEGVSWKARDQWSAPAWM